MLRLYWPRLSTLPTAGRCSLLMRTTRVVSSVQGLHAALISMQIDVDADATRAGYVLYEL
jgi:hypothetical protein